MNTKNNIMFTDSTVVLCGFDKSTSPSLRYTGKKESRDLYHPYTPGRAKSIARPDQAPIHPQLDDMIPSPMKPARDVFLKAGLECGAVHAIMELSEFPRANALFLGKKNGTRFRQSQASLSKRVPTGTQIGCNTSLCAWPRWGVLD